MDLSTFALLPGHSLVEIETLFSNANTHGIILPDIVSGRAVSVGRIIKSNTTGKDRALLGVDELTGRRVVLGNRTGVNIAEGMRVIPNVYPLDKKRTKFDTDLLAFIPDETKVVPVHEESERCRFCGPANAANSQLSPILVAGPGGVEACPRCGKTSDGRVVDFQKVGV